MFTRLNCIWPRLSLAFRVNLLAVLVILVFNEYLVYYVQRVQWHVEKCKTDECNRILFVADPQLLGENNEWWFARWDNDRHISKNFRQAFSHVKPDAVIFLGDLMDEGSVADNEQFQRYHRRFLKVFKSARSVDRVYVPGDNDIGGEGWEPVKREKVERFQIFFSSHDKLRLKKHLNVYVADLIRRYMPEPDKSEDFLNATRILVGHYPLTHGPDSFSSSAIKRFQPHAIFSAHDHKSSKSISKIDSLYPRTTFLGSSTTFDLESMHNRSEILEIQVPSCSYRMGALRIGFGQAVFENGKLNYTPLFVINRFVQFAVYVVLAFLMIIVNCTFRRNRLKYQNYSQV